MKKLALLSCSALIAFACSQKKESPSTQVNSQEKNELYLLVGTYTSGSSTGIYVYDFNTETGDIQYVSDIKGVSNPSYLAISEDEKRVYSVSENTDGEDSASAFSFDGTTGTLEFLNSQLTKGKHPCYINATPTFVATANYTGGNLSVFPLTSDGRLDSVSQVFGFGLPKEVKKDPASRIHTIIFSPDGKYAFASDLGKDQIHKFTINADGGLNGLFLKQGEPASFNLEKGSGPRHLVFDPNGNHLYCINELSGKVTVFDYADGMLSAVQYIASDTTTEAGKKGSADIQMTPDGKFLYASNRLKADGIAIFSVNPTDGKLTSIGYQSTGIHPRNFIITPDGKFLLVANRDSNNIQVFAIDSQTGLLKNIGKEVQLDKPVCLKFISK